MSFGSEARACSANQHIIWGNGIRQMGLESRKTQNIRSIQAALGEVTG